MKLKIKNLTKSFEGEIVLDHLNLEIDNIHALAIVGASGGGKTTLLRILAGLETPDSGQIFVNDKEIIFEKEYLQEYRKTVGMVFQAYNLFPHMSATQNLVTPLEKVHHMTKKRALHKSEELFEKFDLAEHKDKLPHQLSGGQRQRVAMGRAIVRNPQVFLMDEPLSNLDAKLRVATRAQIAKLQRDLNTTMLYVTHDQVEAMTMGDRVAVLKDGILQQVDTPRELYHNPVNAFVAGFIGSPSMNLFEAPVAEGRVDLKGFGEPVPAGAGTVVTVGVRPEHLRMAADGHGLRVTVDLVEELGADSYLHCSTDEGDPVVYRAESGEHPRKGETIHLEADDGEVRFFDTETGARLR